MAPKRKAIKQPLKDVEAEEAIAENGGAGDGSKEKKSRVAKSKIVVEPREQLPRKAKQLLPEKAADEVPVKESKSEKVKKKATKKGKTTDKKDDEEEKEQHASEEEVVDEEVPKKKPKKLATKGKGKKKMATASNVEEEGDKEQEPSEETDDDVLEANKKPVAKSRGKKKNAAAANKGEAEDAEKATEIEGAKPKRGKQAEGDVKPKAASKKPKAKEEDEEDSKTDDDDDDVKFKPKKAKLDADPKGKQKPAGKTELLNQTETDYAKIDFSCKRENAKGQPPNLKIASWNVDGLRAWLKKGGLEYISREDPDVMCLQETKCGEGKLPDEVKGLDGYKDYWCASEKEGYAGVAVYSKVEPANVEYGVGNEEFDNEGRAITVEYDGFYLVNVYVPNAGRGLVTLAKRLKWNEIFKEYIKKLDEKKPVIVCGDMNVAHEEIDLANPSSNKNNAGFTPEERSGMTEFLADGYVDVYRDLYPDKKDVYTFWSYMTKARSKNVGWRLDYFIVSKRLMENVCDSVIRSEVFGADHCPIALFLRV